MKKYFALLAFLIPLIFAHSAHAVVCAVCTVAVGFGLGLSRWLGIDDSASGVWVGGLIISLGIWLATWLRKKNVKFKYLEIVSVVLFALLTILPLYFSKIIGHPLNTIWGIDKLLVGIIGGFLAFTVGIFIEDYIRKGNNGKARFHYQKVIVPVSSLLIMSLLFYLLTK